MTARVDVVVVSHETRDALLACLASLDRAGEPLRRIVVDNASRDGSADAVRSAHPAAHVIPNPRNVGFAAAANQGSRAGTAPFVLFLNSDAALEPGALTTLADRLDADPGLGAVGPRIVRPDGCPELSIGADLDLVSEWQRRRLTRALERGDVRAREEAERRAARDATPDWLTGACLLVRRRALDDVGGFDESFFLYEEDADLCLRLRAAGWRLLFTPAATVRHVGGLSTRSASAGSRLAYERSHVRYYEKHRSSVETALLRAWLALAAMGTWLAALGPGPSRRDARSLAAQRLRQAVSSP